MVTGLFRTERGRRALLGLSLTAAFAVACGSDNSSNPFAGGGGGGSAGSAGTGQGGTAVSSSGASSLGGANFSGSAGVSGSAGTGGELHTGGASAGGAGGTNTAGASTGGASTGGTSTAGASSGGTSGASTGGASGSAGATQNGGSGGALAGTGGTGGSSGGLGAAGDDGAAGAADDCGGHGCPAPTIITTPNPNGLALDDTYVYWTTVATTGTVQRAPIAGGAAQPVASSEPDAFDLAVAGGNAFWLLNDTTVGEVVEASVTGSNRLQLGAGVATGFPPALSNVSSDGTSVYFVANFNDIAKIPAGVTTPSPLPAISVGPNNSNIIDMVLFGGLLYYTNNGIFNAGFTGKLANTAAIRSVDPAAGNGSVTLVSQLNFPLFQIAVDSAHIFWNDDQNIYSTGLIGGTATQLIAVDPVTGGTAQFPASPVSDMVSDGVNLYYADAHTVYRVPVGGGARHTVSFGWQSIQRLAVDANNLYFTDFTGNAVVELAK